MRYRNATAPSPAPAPPSRASRNKPPRPPRSQPPVRAVQDDWPCPLAVTVAFVINVLPIERQPRTLAQSSRNARGRDIRSRRGWRPVLRDLTGRRGERLERRSDGLLLFGGQLGQDVLDQDPPAGRRLIHRLPAVGRERDHD